MIGRVKDVPLLPVGSMQIPLFLEYIIRRAYVCYLTLRIGQMQSTRRWEQRQCCDEKLEDQTDQGVAQDSANAYVIICKQSSISNYGRYLCRTSIQNGPEPTGSHSQELVPHTFVL